MKKNHSPEKSNASLKVDQIIEALSDWRGPLLQKLRKWVREAAP